MHTFMAHFFMGRSWDSFRRVPLLWLAGFILAPGVAYSSGFSGEHTPKLQFVHVQSSQFTQDEQQPELRQPPTLGFSSPGSTNPANICNRTLAVRREIIRLLGVNSCSQATNARLASIDGRLDLGNKKISSLKSGDFDGLSSLTLLDLNSNSLSSLPTDLFDDLTSLEVLYLWGNELDDLRAGIFDRLSSLTWLYLDQNELKTLPDGLFNRLTSLKVLALNQNALDALPDRIFNGLSSLESLDLGKNKLRTLPNTIFEGLTSLETLHLWGNELGTLPDGIFNAQISLKRLDLRGNSVRTLPTGVFGPLKSLKWLGLHQNEVSSLPGELFTGLDSLNALHLWENSLKSLPKDIFRGLHSLEILGAWKNSMDQIPDGIFDDLSSLTVLGLHENLLRALPDGVFESLVSLPLSTHDSQNEYYGYPGLNLASNPGIPFKPIVDAGVDLSVESGESVALSAKAMGPWGSLVRWEWEQVDGPRSDRSVPSSQLIQLTAADTASPSFTAPDAVGVYHFRLAAMPATAGQSTESWGHMDSEPDWVTVEVKMATATQNSPEIPEFALRGNYPNPFNPSTTILLDLPAPATVYVDLYNLLGQRIRREVFPGVRAGFSNALTLETTHLSSGTYFYQVTAHTPQQIHTSRGRMTRIR